MRSVMVSIGDFDSSGSGSNPDASTRPQRPHSLVSTRPRTGLSGEFFNLRLKELESCDAIFMLRDWKESNGATIEHEKAKEWGLKIIYQNKEE